MAEPDPFEVEVGPAFVADPKTEKTTVAGPTGLPPKGDAKAGNNGEPVVLVGEETVRSLLEAQGALVHGLVAIDDSSAEWVWLKAELDAIVPPLTRIINRYDPLRQLAAVGDPLAVVIAMGGYGRRSLEQRSIARATLQLVDEPTGDAEFSFGGGGA